MAFLAPLAAAGAGAAGTAAATGALAAGTAATATGALASGAMLGSGLTAGAGMSSLLAPTLGAGLSGGLGAGALGAGLGGAGALGAGLGGAGLTAAGGMLAPGLGAAAGLGALAPAAMTGLQASGAMLAPGLGAAMPAALSAVPSAAFPLVEGLPMNAFPGLAQTAAPAAQTLGTEALKQGIAANASGVAQQAMNPALQAVQQAAVNPAASVGQSMAFKTPMANAPWLNTISEGAAIPGVTSNLPAATFGNVAGGPAIPGVTSGLPVSSTQTALVPGSTSPIEAGGSWYSNLGNLVKNPSMEGVKDYLKEHPYASQAGAMGLSSLLKKEDKPQQPSLGMIRPYEYSMTQRPEAYAVSPTQDSSERLYFNETFTPKEPYEAPGDEYKKAAGGITRLAVGGPVEQMAALNAVGSNTGYPMANINTPMYANPMVQRPEAVNVISPSADAGVGAYSGEPRFAGGGGISDLGSYSDGGHLLKGPGDGVSDSIPAVIGSKQPARLADGEFVVPARIVSELGNGSTEAGARKLYAMMDRVQKARGKSVGKNKVAVNSKADKHLPA